MSKMGDKGGIGYGGFVCLGIFGASSMLGLLAAGAAQSMEQPKDAPGLDWPNLMFGFPWWLAERLGVVGSWLMVTISVAVVGCYLYRHNRSSKVEG